MTSDWFHWLFHHRRVTPGRHSGSTTPTKSLLPVPGFVGRVYGAGTAAFVAGTEPFELVFFLYGRNWSHNFHLSWKSLGEWIAQIAMDLFVGCWDFPHLPMFMDPICLKNKNFGFSAWNTSFMYCQEVLGQHTVASGASTGKKCTNKNGGFLGFRTRWCQDGFLNFHEIPSC